MGTGFVNGDVSAGTVSGAATWTVGGATSTSGNLVAGNHDVSYFGGLVSSLGYGYVNNTASNNELTVTRKALTTSYTAGNKVYDGTTAVSVCGTSAEVITGDMVTLAENAAFIDKNAGFGKSVNISSIALGGDDAANYLLQNSIATTSADITRKPLSVSAFNASKTYGQTTVFNGTEFSSTGLLNGETIGSVTLASAGAAPTANVVGSPYIISPSAAIGGSFRGDNYSISYNNGQLTVNPASLTVTAGNASKTYGQSAVLSGTEFTSSGLLNGETIGRVTLVSAGKAPAANVNGSPYAIEPSAAIGGSFSPGNYSISYNNGQLTINPALLTVTANDKTRQQWGLNPAFDGRITGFMNGEDGSVLTVQPAYSTEAKISSLTGSYPITAAGAVASNYTFAYVDGTLRVTRSVTDTVNNILASITGLRKGIESAREFGGEPGGKGLELLRGEEFPELITDMTGSMIDEEIRKREILD
jgi:hypothetical protein